MEIWEDADGSKGANTPVSWGSWGEAAKKRRCGEETKLLNDFSRQRAGSLQRLVLRQVATVLGDFIPRPYFLRSTAWTRSPLINCEWEQPTTSETATSARRLRRSRPCRMVSEEERGAGGIAVGWALPSAPQFAGPSAMCSPLGPWSENSTSTALLFIGDWYR